MLPTIVPREENPVFNVKGIQITHLNKKLRKPQVKFQKQRPDRIRIPAFTYAMQNEIFQLQNLMHSNRQSDRKHASTRKISAALQETSPVIDVMNQGVEAPDLQELGDLADAMTPQTRKTTELVQNKIKQMIS